jgi:PAS domain S-box-containing protein
MSTTGAIVLTSDSAQSDLVATLFRHSRDAIVIFDPDGEAVLEANDSACLLYGYSREEFLQLSLEEVSLDPADGRRYIDEVLARIEGMPPVRFERTQRHKDGTLIHVDIQAHTIYFNGELAILSIARDLTAARKAERQTRELNLLNSVREILARENDPSLVMRAVVEGIASIYGYSLVSLYLIRDNFLHLQHQVGYDNVISIVPLEGSVSGRVFRSGKALLIPDVSQEPDFLAAISGLTSEICVPVLVDGEVTGVLNVETRYGASLDEDDLTLMMGLSQIVSISIQRASLYAGEQEQRQRAEMLADTNAELYAEMRHYAQELEQRVTERTLQYRRANEEVEAILNTSSDGILLLNAESYIRQANHAVVAMLELDSSSIIGQAFTGYLADESAAPFQAAIASALTLKETQRLEVRAKRRDNTTFPADAIIDPILSTSWRERGVVCSLRDITERRKLEDELRDALEQERGLVEIKSRFGAMVSHEFRTPLAMIQSSSELLQRHYGRMSEIRREEAFHTIQTQVHHLTQLLDDLLTISRADSVGAEFQPINTNMVEFCADIAREIQWLATTSHTIKFDHQGNCVEAMIDRTLIRRALVNLLANAIKYSPNAHFVYLTLICSPELNAFTLEVRDEGIGIPEVDQTHLFETFYRASNAGSIRGTGLGLAIVKRAVDAHNGEVTIKSEVNKGTIVSLRLPFTQNHYSISE